MIQMRTIVDVADNTGAILVFAQSLTILLIVALLEAHDRKP